MRRARFRRSRLRGAHEAEIDREAVTDVPLAGAPCVGAAALGNELLKVHVGHGHIAREQGGARHKRAVLGDEVLAREHEVGGGLALTGVGVRVGAVQPCALAAHEAAAVTRLADDLAGGARVQDDRRAVVERHAHRGRVGDPEVLADLDADAHVLEAGVGAGVHHIGHERHGPPAGERDETHSVQRGRSEPALLIELAVVGQMAFNRQAQQFAGAAHRHAVVEALPVRHGQAHAEQQRRVGRVLEQTLERGLARAQQGAIVEQVAAGVARQAQLGQDQDARAGTRGGVDALQNGRGVARDVAHANLGRGCRDA